MSWHEQRLEVGNGALRCGVYASDASARDVAQFLVFFNGRTEFIEKYRDLPEALGIKEPWGMLTWDHRGQGASDGVRCHIDSFGTFADDAAQVISKVVGNKPYVVLAHSMGALIALVGILSGKLKPQRLFLSSPLLGIDPRPFPMWFARGLSSGCAALGLGRGRWEPSEVWRSVPFATNPYTTDPDRLALLQSSPYRAPGPSFAWIRAMFRAFAVVHDSQDSALLKIPIDIVATANDAVVASSATFQWVINRSRHGGPTNLTLLYDCKHELLGERAAIRDKVCHLVQAWLERMA